MSAASAKLKITLKANQLSNRAYHATTLKNMQGLLAGALDRWCKEAGYPGCRHAVIEYVFDLPSGEGSTKKLNGAQMGALLDWMELERDALKGGYRDSEQSYIPKRDIAELCRVAQIQRGQSEMLSGEPSNDRTGNTSTECRVPRDAQCVAKSVRCARTRSNQPGQTPRVRTNCPRLHECLPGRL